MGEIWVECFFSRTSETSSLARGSVNRLDSPLLTGCTGPAPALSALPWYPDGAMQESAKVAGYINVDPGNVTALKAALYKHGPVAVNIDASPKTFAFYANGVYYEPACELDHAVLAVGYGVLQGESYWLIKNSWSTYWGNDGYILMSMRDNNCGVTTAATYPVLA
uniref:Peptidase C1A papain C-terminal domain-containing protein n=1 Tax=Terrapene triunguis TaxID=2587831 RepID=A0A674J9L2_9SAUR